MGELKDLQDIVAEFRDKREWLQYHSPKNLAQALAAEVGELNDLYLWNRTPHLIEVAKEMADILIYLLSLADVCKIDLTDAFYSKLQTNELNYPINIYKGRSDKHL